MAMATWTWSSTNINDSAFVYRNNLMEREPEKNHFLRLAFQGGEHNVNGLGGGGVEIFYADSLRQVYEHSPYRGYLSSVEPEGAFWLGRGGNRGSRRGGLAQWQAADFEKY